VATLTARDIAKHIQRPGEPLTAAVDRLRNWTKMGIIKPSGAKHPGTGRKKQYSSAALLETILLQTLTDTFGSSAVSLSSLIDQVSKMARAGVLLGFESKLHRQPKVLVLSRPHGADAMAITKVNVKDLGEYISKSDLDTHMVLNLNRLFERLPYDWQDALPHLKQPREDGLTRNEWQDLMNLKLPRVVPAPPAPPQPRLRRKSQKIGERGNG
jgi:hypothetical protein